MNMADTPEELSATAVELATELTIAWLNNPNNRVNAEDVPTFLKTMHAAVVELGTGGGSAPEAAPDYTPAVPVRSSIKPDYLVSLIDGSKLKSLKRHLGKHGLTPKDYRERYNLKADYPMVAATYSEARRAVAKRLGLGRKRGETDAEPAAAAAAPAKAPAKRKVAPKPAALKPAPLKAAAPKSAATKPAPAKRGRPKKDKAPAA
jgi:predicted transcriptional regulator